MECPYQKEGISSKLVEARNVKYTAHTILCRPLESILYNMRF